MLLGSESADVAGYQTGIRLAHALGLPVVTGVKGLTVDDGVARCERAVGSEREVYSVALPAVITVKDGLNIPRYPSVPGRIKARKKEVSTHEVTLAAPHIVKGRLVVPAAAAKGTKVLDANAWALRVSSKIPTTEISEEAFTIRIASLIMAGRMASTALGS